ncbi:hypothetical protein EA187_17470 [Lujinxingia sediminis]|uniref:Uncharacterized protein n=1 Tax=Lujinxingia sediminis TaxID=2480984 RepID=A0ABY0CPZ5_9DELT|nr:hypothetical protein [Lujinxingia sediminis]RVU42127.1 hypothetical protein EA187_17470 [Lujinxingia sediminis]
MTRQNHAFKQHALLSLFTGVVVLVASLATSACTDMFDDCGPENPPPTITSIYNTPLIPTDDPFINTTSEDFQNAAELFDVVSVHVTDDEKVHVTYIHDGEQYVDIYNITEVENAYL